MGFEEEKSLTQCEVYSNFNSLLNSTWLAKARHGSHVNEELSSLLQTQTTRCCIPVANKYQILIVNNQQLLKQSNTKLGVGCQPDLSSHKATWLVSWKRLKWLKPTSSKLECFLFLLAVPELRFAYSQYIYISRIWLILYNGCFCWPNNDYISEGTGLTISEQKYQICATTN
jgi:hypothetical protein